MKKISVENDLRFQILPLKKIPISKLWHLTMRFPDDVSGMMELLIKLDSFDGYKERCKGFAVLVRDGNKIIGWLAGCSITNGGKCHNENFINIGLFVDAKFRRQGIGGRMIDRANRYSKLKYKGYTLYVYPHDARSSGFFRSVKDDNIRVL